jgi:hypothetical protein
MPTQNAPDVANDLQAYAAYHGDGEGCCAPGEGIGEDKAEEGDGEECQEYGVGGEGYAVEVI